MCRISNARSRVNTPPFKEWVDAVLATGFDGCWACELLSPKYWELDPWKTVRDLKSFLEYMLL